MARLEKTGARKPLIKRGGAYTGCDYIDTNGLRGGMPPVEYRLTVATSGEDGSYTMSLSEAEMLNTIAGWLKLYTRNREKERRT